MIYISKLKIGDRIVANGAGMYSKGRLGTVTGFNTRGTAVHAQLDEKSKEVIGLCPQYWDMYEPQGLEQDLSKAATERTFVPEPLVTGGIKVVPHTLSPVDNGGIKIVPPIPTPDEVQEHIGTRSLSRERSEGRSAAFVAAYGGEQVGGDHYGTGTDVYALSLEREHDCLQHSAIKYIDRHKLKNGRQDIEKAISVLHRILKEQYND